MSIKKCACSHAGQDSLHGDHMRVFNHVPKPGTTPDEYRCTVCGKVETSDKKDLSLSSKK